MSERVTATEAARRFSDLLNRVRYGRETFVVVRGGEEVAQISPASPSRRVTLRELVETLRRLGPPDDRFAEDLAEIQASQPPIGEAPWPS
ncbi:MAG TPA: type II toxin-antitoxin system prevent-host-death family antitoxin [Thermoanaerobaculia bacterium]